MGNVTVLLVEDEWIIADALRQSLEGFGYDVPYVLSTGEEAVQKAEEMNPDVVLMDIILQGEMDGIEAARRIHSRSSVPIIYLTAHADKERLERAKVTRPFAYMVKPVKDMELQAAIEIALYRYQVEKLMKRRSLDLKTLYEASTAISSNLSLDAVLNTVAEQLTQALEFSGCRIFRWNVQQNLIETLLDYGLNQSERRRTAGTVYDLREYQAKHRVLKGSRSELILYNNASGDKAELAFMKTRGIKTMLILPLVARDNVLGLVELVDAGERRESTPEEIHLAQSLAAHAAIALENAQLYIMARKEISERKKTVKKLRVSEKKYRELSDQLAEANNLKDILLDVISHDFRNPVSVINSMANILLEEHRNDEKLQIIKSNSDNLIKILQETTAIACVLLGDEIAKEPLDLKKVIQDVSSEFSVPLKNAGMRVEVRLGKELFVLANPIIGRVFRNFISNAIKYAPNGKRVVIVAKKHGDMITIGVKDFGRTISESDYSHIFERRVQLESEVGRGRGLGLAIAKRIAEAHSAEIWVEPNRPKGNIFYLRMQIARIEE